MSVHANDEYIFENDRVTEGFDILFSIFNDRYSYVPTHWHNAIEITCTVSGSVTVHFDGKEERLTAGDVFLCDSCVPHSVSSPDGNVGILLQLPFLFLKKYIPDVENYVFAFDPHSKKDDEKKSIEKLRNIILKMKDIFEQKPSGGILKFNSLMFSLLYVLQNDFARPLGEHSRRPVLKAYSRLEPVLSYCDEHYREQISLSDAAQIACLQEEYFCHLFKKNMGMTFLRYLNELRLSHIYRDLMETELPVKQIAAEHGFSNYKLFRTMFREKFNTTPAEYRKLYAARK